MSHTLNLKIVVKSKYIPVVELMEEKSNFSFTHTRYNPIFPHIVLLSGISTHTTILVNTSVTSIFSMCHFSILGMNTVLKQIHNLVKESINHS